MDTILKGLPGLGSISEQERQQFMLDNEDKLRKYKTARQRRRAAEILYDNTQFHRAFGDEGFEQAKAAGYDLNTRNQLLEDKIVNDAFSSYNPIGEDGIRNNSNGLGRDWEKYNQMSTSAKRKLLESKYLTPQEFEKDWQEQINATTGREVTNDGKVIFNPLLNIGGFTQSLAKDAAYGEAEKKRARTKNDRILERIYTEDAVAQASTLNKAVRQVYNSGDPSIVGGSDEDTVNMFKNAITPNPSLGNYGIPEYASHFGVVDGEGISSEMKNFSIDNMRQVLAKKAVYEQYMSPDMAAAALNDEAKRYIHNQQGSWKKAGLFAKDVAISTTSYSVDKINAFSNLALPIADGIDGKPTVYVDDKGEILSLDDERIGRNAQGILGYVADTGEYHPVHKEKISRVALYNMGKNTGIFDTAGSDNKSVLNPADWSRKEQFGVWDSDLAKQYERIGSSPYKVSFDPDEDRDLLYESFKMMSFGLADMGAQLIPFGIGMLGEAASTAKYLGRIGKTAGNFLSTTSKYLTAETRAGQLIQGSAGAGGIAEAYLRGSFQESLAQNLANLEERNYDTTSKEIEDKYRDDEEYKKQVDALIDKRAAELKAAYIAQNTTENNTVIDGPGLDEKMRAYASQQVIDSLVKQEVDNKKGTEEYGKMQEAAINSAGLVAVNTFWPEAIKYGLINTVGFRKFLYTTPTSIIQRAQRTFSGIREITTSAGRKRLATDAYKKLTNAEKWKQFGKVTASQVWGGSWTNGTDDMMVDAAERINEDSFNRYLHDYETGESTADTYGLADGLFSYWMGLQNSLGQETTAEAALVGGLGGVVSGNIHFTNLASLLTKEGREAFRNNFQQRYKRDDNGIILKDEQGKPIVEELKWYQNIGDKLGFFIQNGILNDYYGKKQELRSLQQHADYVNELLDNYDDFNAITSLVSSNMGRENALNVGDEKTMRFVQAFNAVHALERLGNSEKDPTTLSSVVMQHKNMIEQASKLGTDEQDMSEEEVANLLGQYYSNNPGLPQTEENNQIVLQNIAQNARKLQEAYQAYNKAEEDIQSLERDMGAPIIPAVRFKMKMSQALDAHWKDRLHTMKEEVGDTSADTPVEGETLIAALGGKRKTDAQLKAYGIQEEILLQAVSDAVSQQQEMLEKYNQAQQILRKAEEAEDSEAVLQAQREVKEAKDNYENAIEDRMFREDMLASSREKQQRLQEAVDAWEKGTKSKVLSADEIMALDPVTRATMLAELPINPVTGEKQADPYSAAQRKQIEKLKARLKTQDKTGDPLQKIQDIALLTQRIAQNEDAYHRMSRNPDAAAVQLEKQQKEAAQNAVQVINRRNAEILADYISQMNYALLGRKDVNDKDREDYVYRTLRNKNTTILDIIEQNNLIPNYYPQVQKAKEWAQVISDIDAVLSNMGKTGEQETTLRNSVDKVIEPATSREEIIANLEKEIDRNPNTQVQQDYEGLLDGLTKLGYQRDATVVESRKKRREREEAQRKAEEEKRQKHEAAVKAAAEEAERKRKEEEEKRKKENSDEISNPQGEQSPEVDLNDADFEETSSSGKLLLDEDEKPQNAELDATPAQQNQGSSVNTIMEAHDEVLGDVIQGKSPTLEEQVTEARQDNTTDVQVLSDTTIEDVDKENERKEDSIKTSQTTLSGVAMPAYERSELEKHRLVHKKGDKPNDVMNNYFAWLSNAGIKLQNIIDDELPRVLENNPHTPVRFMRVRPDNNATHDDHMATHLMLVIDYTDDVKKIHNEENGGVIKSDGKEYLVIGTVGYGKESENPGKFALWKLIMDNYLPSSHKFKLKSMEWFNKPEHKAERFFVYDGAQTEIVPDSMTPGYLIRQDESREAEQSRSISQLLEDKEANPQGLKLEDLAWGIQTMGESRGQSFVIVRAGNKVNKVLQPKDIIGNLGRVFVLVPAGNGKLVCAKIDALKYNDKKFNKDSTLYKTIQSLLSSVTSPNYADRKEAIVKLVQYLYFSPDRGGDNILIGRDEHDNRVTVVHGNQKTTFILDSTFDRGQFFKAIEDMNPRINITLNSLSHLNTLKDLDEAGALMTDITKLGTAGISYSIYGVDSEGKMIISDAPQQNTTRSASDFQEKGVRTFHYLHGEVYKYDAETGKFTLNGVEVTNDPMIKYAYKIAVEELNHVKQEGVWDYYIISTGDNPEVVRQSSKTKVIEKLSQEEAQAIIDAEMERIEEEKRKWALLQEAEQQDKGTQEPGFIEDGEGFSFFDGTEESNTRQQTQEEQRPVEQKPSVSVEGSTSQSKTRTFKQLWRSADRNSLIDAIKEIGWTDAPIGNMAELQKYLEGKGAQNLDAIGTSQEDFNAWLQKIKCLA